MCHVGSSSETRDQTQGPVLGAQSLGHWTTREVSRITLLKSCKSESIFSSPSLTVHLEIQGGWNSFSSTFFYGLGLLPHFPVWLLRSMVPAPTPESVSPCVGAVITRPRAPSQVLVGHVSPCVGAVITRPCTPSQVFVGHVSPCVGAVITRPRTPSQVFVGHVSPCVGAVITRPRTPSQVLVGHVSPCVGAVITRPCTPSQVFVGQPLLC